SLMPVSAATSGARAARTASRPSTASRPRSAAMRTNSSGSSTGAGSGEPLLHDHAAHPEAEPLVEPVRAVVGVEVVERDADRATTARPLLQRRHEARADAAAAPRLGDRQLVDVGADEPSRVVAPHLRLGQADHLA